MATHKIVLPAAASSQSTDTYDDKLRTAYEAYQNEKNSTPSVEPRNGIIKLIQLIFKEVVKKGTTQSVKATSKNVITKITNHAIKKMIN